MHNADYANYKPGDKPSGRDYTYILRWIAYAEKLEAENHELKLAVQNYMDACRYADKESLMSAIAVADKRSLELVPRRVYPNQSTCDHHWNDPGGRDMELQCTKCNYKPDKPPVEQSK